MTEDEKAMVAELDALLAAATPEPWELDACDDPEDPKQYLYVPLKGIPILVSWDLPQVDQLLIAELRNNAPALLALCRRLEGERNHLANQLEYLTKTEDCGRCFGHGMTGQDAMAGDDCDPCGGTGRVLREDVQTGDLQTKLER